MSPRSTRLRSLWPLACLAASLHSQTLSAAPVPAPTPSVLQPRAGLKPFEYEPSPEALPNYVSGAQWGTQADPIRTMQKPLSPAESLAHWVMQDGFEARLFASEPDIVKAICLAWDERGRLWIAETLDYPNEMKPAGEGRDRIRICEDTNGDGMADRFTVFADRLSIPTSIVFGNGGLIVAQAPDMIFLQDTDGDDRADVRRILFTGWGTHDTHAGPSNLKWGFDNWIWGTVGYSGFDGVVGGKAHKFGMGFFRFKPDGSALEFVRSSNNNTWGFGWGEDGTVFGSTANGNASMYMPIANRFYEQVRGWSAARLESITTNQGIYPVTPKVRQVDWHGRYTAGAGHALYTARSFPPEYWNKRAFVCEPTGHLIGMFQVQPMGADYISHNLGTFLGSDDEWTAPVAAEVGPDGALWVIDWYNYIVQHNPVPQGFRNGKGNAYETGLRDKRHGRIYRIVHRDGKPTPQPRLKGGSPSDWVETLGNENLLWRMHAQRLLVERGRTDVVPALMARAADTRVDKEGFNVAALHALRTLEGLQAPELAATAVQALTHGSHPVRRAAVAVLPRTEDSLAALLKKEILYDRSRQVRMAALLALAEMPPSPSAGVMVHLVAQNPPNRRQRLLREAAIIAGSRHVEGFLQAVVAKRPAEIHPDFEEVVSRIVAHYCLSSPTEKLLEFLLAMDGASRTLANPVFETLSSRWPADKRPELSPGLRKGLGELIAGLNPEARPHLLTLVRRWGEKELFASELPAAVKRLEQSLGAPGATEAERLRAAVTLVRLADGPSAVRAILSQVSPQAAPSLNTGLLTALAESQSPTTGEAVVSEWKRYSPVARRSALAILLRKPEWTHSLLDAIERKTLPASELGPEHWQQLRSRSDATLVRRASILQSDGRPVSADREAVVKKLLPVATQKGDAALGREVYQKSCAVCHSFKGQGGKVGPDLTGAGARDRADLLIDILDPNRSVESNYRMWNATTREGETYSGRLDAESRTAVELLDVAGQRHVIQRSDLQSLESSELSIMPVGFEAHSERELAGLLEYLK